VRKAVALFTVWTIAMIVVISTSFTTRTVKANVDYTIEHVDHTIQIMYNGYVFVNDTLRLNITGQTGPSDFPIGLPDKYGSHVLKCIAYSGSDTFPVTSNVPLDTRVGFYGARVEFSNGAPQVFTVGFVLSNNLLTQDVENTSLFTLDFPAYPSLTKTVDKCSVSIVAPEGATYVTGTVENFTYEKENLQEFAYSPGSAVFLLAGDKIQIVDIAALKREIGINEFNEIEGADTYEITNRASKEMTHIEVFLPSNASNPSAEDQLGRTMSEPKPTNNETYRYDINFTIGVKTGQSTRFTMKYRLPNNYLTKEGASSFALDFSTFQHENYYIEQGSVTFVLPEGARVQRLEKNLANDVSSIERSVFQETITVNRQGIIALDNLSIRIWYEYNPLWLSFRPTIWVWTLVAVGCVAVAVTSRRSKGPGRVSAPMAAVKLRPEYLKSFIDSYEERKKIVLEMESLEMRVEKGRIPRRRYKVRKKTLEARLSTLSRTLAEFKERIRAAGSQYAGLMVQLEVAEAEINEVGTNIKNTEALHNRGELSFEAYRNRLADYQRRKENAETAINGIILRLREETR